MLPHPAPGRQARAIRGSLRRVAGIEEAHLLAGARDDREAEEAAPDAAGPHERDLLAPVDGAAVEVALAAAVEVVALLEDLVAAALGPAVLVGVADLVRRYASPGQRIADPAPGAERIVAALDADTETGVADRRIATAVAVAAAGPAQLADTYEAVVAVVARPAARLAPVAALDVARLVGVAVVVAEALHARRAEAAAAAVAVLDAVDARAAQAPPGAVGVDDARGADPRVADAVALRVRSALRAQARRAAGGVGGAAALPTALDASTVETRAGRARALLRAALAEAARAGLACRALRVGGAIDAATPIARLPVAAVGGVDARYAALVVAAALVAVRVDPAHEAHAVLWSAMPGAAVGVLEAAHAHLTAAVAAATVHIVEASHAVARRIADIIARAVAVGPAFDAGIELGSAQQPVPAVDVVEACHAGELFRMAPRGTVCIVEACPADERVGIASPAGAVLVPQAGDTLAAERVAEAIGAVIIDPTPDAALAALAEPVALAVEVGQAGSARLRLRVAAAARTLHVFEALDTDAVGRAPAALGALGVGEAVDAAVAHRIAPGCTVGVVEALHAAAGVEGAERTRRAGGVLGALAAQAVGSTDGGRGARPSTGVAAGDARPVGERFADLTLTTSIGRARRVGARAGLGHAAAGRAVGVGHAAYAPAERRRAPQGLGAVRVIDALDAPAVDAVAVGAGAGGVGGDLGIGGGQLLSQRDAAGEQHRCQADETASPRACGLHGVPRSATSRGRVWHGRRMMANAARVAPGRAPRTPALATPPAP